MGEDMDVQENMILKDLTVVDVIVMNQEAEVVEEEPQEDREELQDLVAVIGILVKTDMEVVKDLKDATVIGLNNMKEEDMKRDTKKRMKPLMIVILEGVNEGSAGNGTRKSTKNQEKEDHSVEVVLQEEAIIHVEEEILEGLSVEALVEDSVVAM